jgi:alpha-mannosidase
VRRGYEFNYKPLATQVEPHEGDLPPAHSFVEIGQQNVVLTAMKKSEDRPQLLFRFYEWAGKEGEVELTVPPGAKSATMTNLMEQAEGSPLQVERNRLRVPVHPFEIVSVAVDYPAGGTRAAAP